MHCELSVSTANASHREAVSKWAVAAATGVQAPTIYRLFGDMRGLLEEVTSFGFSAYLRDKIAREHDEDPVEDLRQAWDLHVGFGLANPAFFALMYGAPRPGAEPAERDQVPGRAVALKVVLPEAPAGFTPGERTVLSE